MKICNRCGLTKRNQKYFEKNKKLFCIDCYYIEKLKEQIKKIKDKEVQKTFQLLLNYLNERS